MSDILSAIYSNLYNILSVVITGVLGYVGLQAKKLYQEFVNDKIKKEIVDKTVKYVEQTSKDLSCDEKKQKALEKSSEWLKDKKISISDTELEILIESAVNCLDKKE